MKETTISLGDDAIYTNATGIKQLLKFHSNCSQHRDCVIDIGLENVDWIDGNMCAVMGAIMYRLKEENGVSFRIDANQVAKKCDILFHNNFLPIEQDLERYKKKSCIPFKGFLSHESRAFMEYLENDLLSHTSMPRFSQDTKNKLLDDLGEVYANIDRHAETSKPFFVCGQYFPKQGMVRFTLCDLGIGFYKNIKAAEPQKIHHAGDAIRWAINGNSTKKDAPGGTGLKGLNDYMNEAGGNLQIFSGDFGWSSSRAALKSPIYPDGVIDLKNNYQGAIINLEFNRKALYL